jgi:hypothetical protein
MRIYLYILAGICSSLIGWNLGQVFLSDLGWFKQLPEFVLFPCIAISLAMGMVVNEIFISNPTRPKLSLRKVIIPSFLTIGLGLVAGLIAASISFILFLPQLSTPALLVRILGWMLIGSSVGLAEGFSWRLHSLEAGDRKRWRKRFITSVLGATGASLVAAVLFEFIRSIFGKMPENFRSFEDPVGFAILGTLLGLVFSITNSPSYFAALRAGSGFESFGKVTEALDRTVELETEDLPTIQSPLRFVSLGEKEMIVEEGLSIQLPSTGEVSIGGDKDRDSIYLPGLPHSIAKLNLQIRGTTLTASQGYRELIEINGKPHRFDRPVALKHNQVLTFTTPTNNQKITNEYQPSFYRLVYYNRFLDSQA